MNIMRFLPAMFFLFFVGCKSDHPISSVAIPDESRRVVSASSISTTNIYYEFDQGPGSAVFFPQDVYESIQATGGIKVVVIDGHFPSNGAIPSTSVSASQSFLPLGYGRRDMSLIDDTGTR